MLLARIYSKIFIVHATLWIIVLLLVCFIYIVLITFIRLLWVFWEMHWLSSIVSVLVLHLCNSHLKVAFSILNVFTGNVLNNFFTLPGKIVKHLYSQDLILDSLKLLLLLFKLLCQSSFSTLLLLRWPLLSFLFLPRYRCNFLHKCMLRFDDIDRIWQAVSKMFEEVWIHLYRVK